MPMLVILGIGGALCGWSLLLIFSGERQRVFPAQTAACAGDDDHAVFAKPGHDQTRSNIVTLAWPPPSHMVCRP